VNTHNLCHVNICRYLKNHLLYEQFAKCLKIDIVIENEGQERQRRKYFSSFYNVKNEATAMMNQTSHDAF